MSAEGRFSVRVEAWYAPPATGRRWRVAVCATAERLDEIGLVVDFRRLRASLNECLERLAAEPAAADAGPQSALAVGRRLLASLRARAEGEPYRIAAVEVSPEPDLSFVLGRAD